MQISTEISKFKISGSFVITAIGADGIIMASEARANIFDRRDSSQTPVGYFDTIQKVFPKNNIAIAETGQGLIANVFFSALINDFYSKLTSYQADNLLQNLIHYANQFLPIEIHSEFYSQKLFSAGFIGTKPQISYFNNQQSPSFKSISEGFIQSDKTIFGDSYSSKMSCQELSHLAEEAINEYASHFERWKTIGGPISVLKLTPAGCTWLLNKPLEQKWTYVDEFISDYKSNKFRINLIEPFSEGDLKSILGI